MMNKPNWKIIILMILIIVVIGLCIGRVNALEFSKVGKLDMPYTFIQTCSSCTYVNLTISDRNDILYSNIEMSNNGSGVWTYTFTPITRGRYDATGEGDKDGTPTSFATYFMINGIGEELSSAQSTSYVLIFIFALLVFGSLLALGIMLPNENGRDEMTGYIIAVNNIKYLKLTFLGIAYAIAIFISYFAWMVTYSYLDMDFLINIFRGIFIMLMSLAVPLFIMFCYLTIANLVRDSKLTDMLSRGLRTRGE